MLIALLVAATAPAQTALDIERAFAADAQRIGQWTAFRKWSIPEDAVMFDPQPVEARVFLKNRDDPAQAVRWQPIASYISCDGNFAVNTGAWQTAGGGQGYFTTVWTRTAAGWRWELDHGDSLPTPRAVPATPVVRRAACRGAQPVDAPIATPSGARVGWTSARDGSVRVKWTVTREGERTVWVSLWNGTTFEEPIRDRVAAPPTVVPRP